MSAIRTYAKPMALTAIVMAIAAVDATQAKAADTEETTAPAKATEPTPAPEATAAERPPVRQAEPTPAPEATVAARPPVRPAEPTPAPEATAAARPPVRPAAPTPAPEATVAKPEKAPTRPEPAAATAAAPEAPIPAPARLPLRQAEPIAKGEPPSPWGVRFAALACVVGLGAWLMHNRKKGPRPKSELKLSSRLPIGVRSEIVVVEVGQQTLLLGVTPNAINTLHVLEPSARRQREPARQRDEIKPVSGAIGPANAVELGEKNRSDSVSSIPTSRVGESVFSKRLAALLRTSNDVAPSRSETFPKSAVVASAPAEAVRSEWLEHGDDTSADDERDSGTISLSQRTRELEGQLAEALRAAGGSSS